MNRLRALGRNKLIAIAVGLVVVSVACCGLSAILGGDGDAIVAVTEAAQLTKTTQAEASGPKETRPPSGSGTQGICGYASRAASYLSQTQSALEGAKAHIGSATALQDDINRLANLAQQFRSISTPTGGGQTKALTVSAISGAAGLLRAFKGGRSGEGEANQYLGRLNNAINEIERVRASHGCH